MAPNAEATGNWINTTVDNLCSTDYDVAQLNLVNGRPAMLRMHVTHDVTPGVLLHSADADGGGTWSMVNPVHADFVRQECSTIVDAYNGAPIVVCSKDLGVFHADTVDGESTWTKIGCMPGYSSRGPMPGFAIGPFVQFLGVVHEGGGGGGGSGGGCGGGEPAWHDMTALRAVSMWSVDSGLNMHHDALPLQLPTIPTNLILGGAASVHHGMAKIVALVADGIAYLVRFAPTTHQMAVYY